MSEALTIVPSGGGVEDLLRLAVERGATVETLERLMAIRRELNAERARNEFFAALSAFQAACPVIRKTKQVFERNSTTKVRYCYAPLETIVEQAAAIIKQHGFSYTFDSQMEPDGVMAICQVHHVAGHTERFTFKAPIQVDAYMSEPQKVAAAMTFASRYVFKNAFGILTGDDDTDGADPTSPVEPPQPAKPPQPAPKPAKAPSTTVKALATLQEWLERQRANLCAKLGVHGKAAHEYATKMAIILPNEELTDGQCNRWFPSVDWAKGIEENTAAVLEDGRAHLRALQAFMDGEKMPEPVTMSDPGDPAGWHHPSPGTVADCDSPDAPWRFFPMPFGKEAGIPLAKMPKNKLFGWWANYIVETEYNGKPKRPETIAKDQMFRAMLDEAGKHYAFTKPTDGSAAGEEVTP
jgi:hypothetical protein